AGTLRLPRDAALAKDAGATFAVTPGYTRELGAACREAGLPLLPGVATASELLLAYGDGHRFTKFFPAVAAGGVPLLKALGGPFPDVSFCPTGGITEASAPDFLALPSVPVCGGTWLTPANLVAARDWDAITELARRAAALG
ncbi:MAG: bifunctional 4-hydroxy-2-oxoglutarate aldolase/2-dehydro-3-deoxy-phosphogluconate aldolase, partial [Propionicimonas sp.]